MTARPQPATLDGFARWEAEQPDRHDGAMRLASVDLTLDIATLYADAGL